MALQSYLLLAMLFGGQLTPEKPQEVGIFCADSSGEQSRPPKMQGLFLGDELFMPSDIDRAETGFDEFSRHPVVLITFSNEAANRFGRLTNSIAGQSMPIFLDGKLLSCPVVVEAIWGGQIQISGVLSLSESEKLVAMFNGYRR